MSEALADAAAWPPLLVVMALPVESHGIFERAGVPVLYTGLGKINATMGQCAA